MSALLRQVSYPSEYCTIRPFLDQPNQHGPLSLFSDRLRIRITQGGSVCGALGTLHTRRSPSLVCVASISDFCFDDEPCQAKLMMGDGAFGVVKVCRMVNDGCRVTMRMEPFWKLEPPLAKGILPPGQMRSELQFIPNCKCAAVSRGRQCRDRIENGAR